MLAPSLPPSEHLIRRRAKVSLTSTDNHPPSVALEKLPSTTMKVPLCFGAVVVLLQLVCPSCTKSLPSVLLVDMLQVVKTANTSLPGHLLNSSVPVMDYCKNTTFCDVQQVLLELPKHYNELEPIYRHLSAYNRDHFKNCTEQKLQNNNETFELRDLFLKFEDCIQHQIFSGTGSVSRIPPK